MLDTREQSLVHAVAMVVVLLAMTAPVSALAQVQSPQPVRWPAPKPCTGTPILSHGRAGVGPQLPLLSGTSLPMARAVLRRNGLQIDERLARGTGQPDVVISQSPPPGTAVVRGDTVIVCSWLPTRFPSVVFMKVQAAQRIMNDSGFGAFLVDSFVTSQPEIGIVLRQQPVAGTIAPTGSVDTLIVGIRAPPPTRPMPDLANATYAQASRAIRALDAFTNNQLQVTWRGASGASYTSPGSIVITQRPSAGTPVQAGDAILVVLRDTTSAPPPAPVFQMPDLSGGYLAALRTLAQLRTSSGLALALSTTGAPDVGSSRRRLVVTGQSPAAGAVLTPSSAISLVLRDTTTPPPLPSFGMPTLTGGYIAALGDLARFRATTGFALTMTTAGAADVPNARGRLVVTRQVPTAGSPLFADTSVVLILRDTTTPPPPPQSIVTPQAPAAPVQRVRMPNVKGRTMLSAARRLDSLRTLVRFAMTRTLIPTATGAFDSTRAIVDSQSPRATTILSAQSDVRLFLRDTTSRPVLAVTIMPDLVGRTVGEGRSTIRGLGVPLRATRGNGDESADDDWLVTGQSPAAGDTVPESTTVRLFATNPVAPLWPWILAAGVVLAAAVAGVTYNRGRIRVARMSVVPHVDATPPRVKLTMRTVETDDEMFRRIGLSFTPVADRGGHTITRLVLAPTRNGDDHG